MKSFSRKAFSNHKGDNMKKRFRQTLLLFLLLTLLLAPLRAAWAEEWDEYPEEEWMSEAAEEDTDWMEEAFFEEVFFEEPESDVGEEAEMMAEEPGNLPIPVPTESADRKEPAPVEFAAEGVRTVFAAQELDTDIWFGAVLNGAGNLDFYLLLPENAPQGAYMILADDGQGGTAARENAAGERTVPVFTNVRPDQLLYDMSFTLSHAGEERSISVWTYLSLVPDWYPGLDVSMPMAVNTAQYSGAITGVEDWHARLDFDGGDTSLLLCFRAEDAAGLQFACDGHRVTGPTLENDGLWTVRINGISVAELPADLVILAARDGEAVRLQFSPFYYAAVHWNEGTPFVLLCKALTAVLAAA